MIRTLNQHRQLYVWTTVIAILAFALGVRMGRHHPYSMWDTYGVHLYSQQPDIFSWFRR